MNSTSALPPQKSMAEELWNRVNIPFPGAVSCVLIHFTSETDVLVKNVLLVIETVLKLLDNESLQTEVRVLYELLYILNNSYRGNKSYKGLQQVEQCVNRLKMMKLVEALQELSDLCPKRIQRKMGMKSGECSVPSQPMLEWLCLKILGAAHLMNRTLERCIRAFLLCNQQMKWEEFIVLNMVITSLLARLWVIFRGVLVSLSSLYEKILCLCSEVAKANPMPFLQSSLPPNLSELLDPALLNNQICKVTVEHKNEHKKGESSSHLRQKQGSTKRVKEDLGVFIKRDTNDHSDLEPFVKIFNTFTKKSHPDDKPKNNGVAAKMRLLKNDVKKSTSFGDLDDHLRKFVQWCKSKQMVNKRRLFNFLLLKCQKMKHMESDGHNVQRKLNNFRREVLKACSKGFVQRRTPASLAEFRRENQARTNFLYLRSKLKSNRNRSTRKWDVKQKKSRKSKSSRHQRHKDTDRRTEDEAIPQSSHCDSQDDIDDIFASIGL